MKIVKDENRCVASGMCCFIAPEVFELRKGVMHLREPHPEESFRERMEMAVAQCPAEALTLLEEKP